jgi:hypothetical protein
MNAVVVLSPLEAEAIAFAREQLAGCPPDRPQKWQGDNRPQRGLVLFYRSSGSCIRLRSRSRAGEPLGRPVDASGCV